MQKQPYKPDLPRPTAVVKGATWADIWNGIATLSKQNQNLVQYLQNYLTNLFKWIVPAKYIVSVVQPPYTVNSTDAFIAATAGPVTLPAASGSGRVIIVKNIDTTGGTVMVLPQGTDTIDGGVETDITVANDAIRLIDGAAGTWFTW